MENHLANTAAGVAKFRFECFDGRLRVGAVDCHGSRKGAPGRCCDSAQDPDDGDPPDDDEPCPTRGELSEAVKKLGHGKPFAIYCTSEQIIALVQKSVKSG